MKKCIPKQTSLLYSYFKVSIWLYIALLLFIAESVLYKIQLNRAQELDNDIYTLFWLGCFLFSFTHIFLVLLDSWSRFQNYKRLKDQLFMYGFQAKIANNYKVSKCQRRALKVACYELNLQYEYHRYLNLCHIKWYHFIPYFMVEDPLFLFKKHFWSRTFLEKPYVPKFDYKEIYIEILSFQNNKEKLPW
ncbi:hypothetical protein [Mesonia aestuariivivens]|uniref:Uncharacterized protein n=1 Tax=Mesonia aestuariivivens TaxID=2796128 RepID=A0ABS6W583_9FLAO|nr:hypothetical protein [Mesonia aestuariivivens]MBW2963027.1 hypothetical protein [Mesonia aestuariivivens]